MFQKKWCSVYFANFSATKHWIFKSFFVVKTQNDLYVLYILKTVKIKTGLTSMQSVCVTRPTRQHLRAYRASLGPVGSSDIWRDLTHTVTIAIDSRHSRQKKKTLVYLYFSNWDTLMFLYM